MALEGATPPTLVLHIVDYAHVESWDLGRAQHEVARVLGAIGVRLIWREDRGPKVTAGNQDATVLILSKSMSARMPERDRIRDGVLGMAAWRERAWVYFEAVENVAARRDLPVGRILGAVIAHEIGHLVGNLPHSERGLMRAALDVGVDDVGLFTTSEGQQIRAMLRPTGSESAPTFLTSNSPQSVP